MIPKTIHYCWFGKSEKPPIVKKCMQSWEMLSPEWKIVEWNEENFDLNECSFIKEAYEKRKWAFVSDYVRLKVLYQYGGFYMDTDVEILQKEALDSFCMYKNVFPFENQVRINTGMFCACEKKSDVIKKLMESYKEIHFTGDRNQVNTMMNLPIFESLFPSLKWDTKRQIIEESLFITTGEYNKIMKHYALHSWLDDKVDYKVRKENRVMKALRNQKLLHRIKKCKLGNKFYPIYEFFAFDFLDMGAVYFFKRFLKKHFKKTPGAHNQKQNN